MQDKYCKLTNAPALLLPYAIRTHLRLAAILEWSWQLLSTLSEGDTGKINLLTTCRHLTLSITKSFLLFSHTIATYLHSGSCFVSLTLTSLASLAFITAISLLQCNCYYHLPYRIILVASPWNILMGSSTISQLKIHRASWYPATLMTWSNRETGIHHSWVFS